MSISALNWAYEQRLPQTSKSVLVALAYRHNAKTGVCNPSVETLILMTGASERSVQRALKQLQKDKYIAAIGSGKGGRAKSTKWRLLSIKGCQTGTLSKTLKGAKSTGYCKMQKGVTVAPDREVYTKGPTQPQKHSTFCDAGNPSHNLRLVAGGATC